MRPCFLILILFFTMQSKAVVTLSDCGKVIGHEMGLWEFLTPNPGPDQVHRVLKTQLNFVKVSLQKLKDGVWVVNHDPRRMIRTGDGQTKNLEFKDITWAEVEALKTDPRAFIPIYQLKEYVEKDQGRLCWMLSPKEPVDKELIADIVDLGIQDRTVILTGGITDVKFLIEHSVSSLNFAGRVGSDEKDLMDYVPYVSHLWAMEINPTPKTESMIRAVHNMGLKAYVDSMKYNWNYEFFDTACKKVFGMGADFTQTNRPLACMKKMGL